MIASGDLRAYLRGLAGRVWTDQTDARHFGLELQEETITELLLLQMARDLSPHGLKIQMFNKRKEGGVTRADGTVEEIGNGADWEWFVDLPNCQVGFRVQAKRLFGSLSQNGYYGGLTLGGTQIDDLIKSAGTEMNPVYIFYNHAFTRTSHLFTRSPKTNWFGGSAWGCSVATAEFVKSLKSRTIPAVLPGMVPWHRFFALSHSTLRGCSVDRMMRDMLGGQVFNLATKRPDWLKILMDMPEGPVLDKPDTPPPDGREEESDSDVALRLNGILADRRLEGVAYFDFREI